MLPHKPVTEIDLLKSPQTLDRRPRQAWIFPNRAVLSHFLIPGTVPN
jgi:hypothetical protein